MTRLSEGSSSSARRPTPPVSQRLLEQLQLGGGLSSVPNSPRHGTNLAPSRLPVTHLPTPWSDHASSGARRRLPALRNVPHDGGGSNGGGYTISPIRSRAGGPPRGEHLALSPRSTMSARGFQSDVDGRGGGGDDEPLSVPMHRNYTSAKGFSWWVNDPGPRGKLTSRPSTRPVPNSQVALLKAVLLDPPASLREILESGRERFGGDPLLFQPLPSASSSAIATANEALWSEFQTDVRHRFEHRNDPPQPIPPPRFKSNRGPKVKRRKAHDNGPPDTSNLDWTGKVAFSLHNIMKAQMQKVDNVFKKFDSDKSGELDASEFYCALLELGIPESLKIPEEEVGKVLQEVFDTMDADSNGTLSFKEINKYLRAGKYEVVLDKNLQAGAVAVQSAGAGVQQHRTRRKEEWKALDRFAALDVTKTGAATMRELMAFFLSEGYTEDFVKSLMAALDVNSDGSITAEEWRAGVSMLRGSSLLMSMTDPIDPPSGENFKDLGKPLNVIDFKGYSPKSLKFGASISPVSSEPPKEGKYSRGCVIDKPEQRGIELRQLRAVCAHITRRCLSESWVNTDGESLDGKKVTMYDCAAYVIKPATRKKKCSFVETIARGPQPPSWFVSHWWGLPLHELLLCLEQHARDRQLDLNTTSYWISAFALSQWQLDCPILPDVDKTVYMRAMNACQGTISCVESGGEGYFSRVWCVYELGLALALSQGMMGRTLAFMHDMYTPLTHKISGQLHPQRPAFDLDEEHEGGGAPAAAAAAAASASTAALMNFCPGHLPPPENPNQKGLADATEQRHAVGLTEGPTMSDLHPQAKTAREAHFPSAVLEQAMLARIQGGQTSVESDRNRILNVCVGVTDDLDKKPNPANPRFGDINGRIRAATCKSCMVRAAIAAAQNDNQMFDALCKGLEESSITSVEIDFRQAVSEGINVPYKVFDRLLSSLPRTTEEVSITLPASVTKLPQPKLRRLPLLHTLTIHDCAALELLPEDLTECYSLTSLDLTNCVRLIELPKKMLDLRKLKTLNLTNCNLIRTLHARGAAKSCLEAIILHDCSGFTELPEALGSQLGALQMLNLRGCTALNQLPSWVNEMEKNGVAVMRPFHLE